MLTGRSVPRMWTVRIFRVTLLVPFWVRVGERVGGWHMGQRKAFLPLGV